MLLYNKALKCILSSVVLVLLLVIITSAEDKQLSAFKTLDGVKQILSLYQEKSFNAYVKERSNFDISDYHTAIEYLFNEYRTEISKTDGCFAVMKEMEKNQNKEWVNDLVAFAGKDYIVKNLNSLQQLISNINRKNVRLFCQENEKNVIFSEVNYILNFKEFLNEYLSYVETLPKQQQKLRIKNINVAKSIIESMENPPMQNILYGNRVESYLSLLHKVKINSDIAAYLINHPAFNEPFNLMQAIGDLRNLVIQDKDQSDVME